MKISIVCSDTGHPILAALQQWQAANSQQHEISIVQRKQDLDPSNLLFLISCHELITRTERDRHGAVLVIHASDLPRGRGWSPHVWQILDGRTDLTVTLLEAEDKVDSGRIWAQEHIHVPEHALFDEINLALFQAELKLMDFAVANVERIEPRVQQESVEATYYRKRTPDDSELDPEKSIAEQFDIIRVSDPDRYPAFFRLHGHTYKITLEKVDP